MFMKEAGDIRSADTTPETLYHGRREWIKTATAALGGIAMNSVMPEGVRGSQEKPKMKGLYDTDEKINSYKDITTYNNFYEFGTDKSDPAENSEKFKPKPWSVAVEGHVRKPALYNLEDILKQQKIEERVYRMRCVEGWSMVIPWMGFQLSEFIKRLEPTSKAKFVAFETLFRPEEMVGQRRPYLTWPYVEGLRMDEAMNPLTLLATGLYGKPLPNQNGAPLRLVTPWKYGFKGIKSIVKIRFVENEPPTTWNIAAPDEYGFYSNVNPDVDHPRWSQGTERRIGEFRRRKTLMFNGYADLVSSMYAGMDMKMNY
ncbi:MAG: protein-methionine-sulfoxide reductase catalytic subunit MsrP [Bacteroidota bacterium]